MRSKYRITKTLSILLMVFSVFFFLFSNHWVFLSHQRFGALANLQMQHLRNLENRLSDVVVVGHRGSGLESTKGDLLIGNTRSAIDVAMEADVDWIEVDVRRTQDGHFVLFHDETLDAKTDAAGQIEAMQLKEVASVELLLPDDENRNILSLEEVLAEYQASHPNLNWILDLKLGKTNSTGDGLAERIRQASCFRAELPRLLDRLGITSHRITIFGDAEIIQAFSDTKFNLGYTLLFASHKDLPLSQEDVFEHAAANGHAILVVPIVFVTASLVENAKEKNLQVWSYDSNDIRDLRYCVACGVSGLIVDNPDADISCIR